MKFVQSQSDKTVAYFAGLAWDNFFYRATIKRMDILYNFLFCLATPKLWAKTSRRSKFWSVLKYWFSYRVVAGQICQGGDCERRGWIHCSSRETATERGAGLQGSMLPIVWVQAKSPVLRCMWLARLDVFLSKFPLYFWKQKPWVRCKGCLPASFTHLLHSLWLFRRNSLQKTLKIPKKLKKRNNLSKRCVGKLLCSVPVISALCIPSVSFYFDIFDFKPRLRWMHCVQSVGYFCKRTRCRSAWAGQSHQGALCYSAFSGF